MELESVLVKEAGVVQTSFSCRMSDARGHQWLYFLVYLLTFLRSDASPDVPITIIHDAVKAGAVCLDGSPPAYHLDRGFGSGIKSWLVHMEGGGWCNDLATCLRRKTNRLGSSTVMERELRFTGILNHRGQSNPDFHNWNRVKIRYCDGSSFTGDVEEVYTTTNLHFRGARVWLAVMEDLLKQGLNNAENALLSGCSSAGLASMLHCDSFRALLPMGTKVKCLSDGGYFINAKDISGAPKIQNYFDEVVTLHGSAKNLPSSCTSRMQPGLCFFPQNIAGLIRTPLFILNSAIDSWQIRSVLAPADNDPLGTWKACKTDIKNCSTKQLQIMQAFQAMDEMVGIRKFLQVLCKPRLDFLKALQPLSSAARGFFINSCYAHCQAELTETWLNNPSPLLDNTTIAKAVGDWFYDRRPFQEIGFPYPCDSTCVNFIYP